MPAASPVDGEIFVIVFDAPLTVLLETVAVLVVSSSGLPSVPVTPDGSAPAVTPVAGTLVAAIVPLPLVASDAPEPTTIAAVVLVPEASELKAGVLLPPQLPFCHQPVVEL